MCEHGEHRHRALPAQDEPSRSDPGRGAGKRHLECLSAPALGGHVQRPAIEEEPPGSIEHTARGRRASGEREGVACLPERLPGLVPPGAEGAEAAHPRHRISQGPKRHGHAWRTHVKPDEDGAGRRRRQVRLPFQDHVAAKVFGSPDSQERLSGQEAAVMGAARERQSPATPSGARVVSGPGQRLPEQAGPNECLRRRTASRGSPRPRARGGDRALS